MAPKIPLQFMTWSLPCSMEVLQESYSQDWVGEEQEEEQAKTRWWLLNSQLKTPVKRQSTPLPESPVLLAVLVSTALLVLQLLRGPGWLPLYSTMRCAASPPVDR